ncbi:hypothetical protein V1514DRAFT_337219 [Lipomyces japonicus]|uniref:uncharacterized protein n=1 Tax=Lipomyces japonicus TaxID=56871 RepID=UPI0034D0108E
MTDNPEFNSSILSAIIFLLPRIIKYTLLGLIKATWFVPSKVLILLGPLLSASFSITLSFSCLLIIMIVFIALVWAVVRYRYLNVYSRLPIETRRNEPKLDMMYYPEAFVQPQFTKPGFSSYLDEFFSGIKIFGYLEKPVFHELTRQVQTRKLIAGDTISLEDEKGFCIVVDGDIQIFSKDRSRSENDEDGSYRLLTEVKNGAPMSSLFTIISLFTEDIQLPFRQASPRPPFPDTLSGEDTLHNQADYNTNSPGLPPVPSIPPLSEPSNAQEPLRSSSTSSSSVHPGIIARAKVDSTIAVIPAEAFHRLTRKYPKSAAHIMQVILARFQRVTFQTGHNYLGLTSEILKTEVAFNKLSIYELPNYVSEDILRKVKSQGDSKLYNDGVIIPTPDIVNQLNLDNNPSKSLPGDLASSLSLSIISPTLSHKHSRPSISSLKSYGGLDLHQQGEDNNNINVDNYNDEAVESDSDEFESNIGYSNHLNEEETVLLKKAVMECIFKAMGVAQATFHGKPSLFTSAETSPRLNSFENRRSSSLLSAHTSQVGVDRLSPFPFDSTNIFFDDDSATSSTAPQQSSSSISPQPQILDAANDIQILHYKPGAKLVEQGDKNKGLYYVIDGFLDVSTHDKPGEYSSIYTIKPGGIGGYLGSISGYRSFVDIRATTNAHVAFLPQESIDRIIDQQPAILLTLAKRLIGILSHLILYLDFALEWVHVEAGEVLYRQGDVADSIYIVMNGRMRALKDSKGTVTLAGEYGQGDSVGELEVLTARNRPFTLHTVRETELIKFPRMLFESLAMQYPAITIQVSKIIASRVDSLINSETPHPYDVPTNAPSSGNFRTVAILPVTSGLPVKKFGEKLAKAFTQIGHNNFVLDQATILKHLGRHSFNKFGKLKLSGYLTDLEERYQMVLYVADTSVNSPWTQTCISQADCILLLASTDSDPAIGEYERLLVGTKTTARKELVLLHPDRYVPPGQTNAWLKNRLWIHSHHHVQMQVRGLVPRSATAFFETRISSLKSKVQKVQNTLQLELQKYMYYVPRYAPTRPVYRTSQVNKNDFARLARLLSGKSVGLVLGGGGARGLSHLGVIHAIEEAGIPIDIVGGTSIGAFVGGLYARDADIVPIYGRLKKFSGRIGSLWRMMFDLTYPATSYTTGHEFNRGIWKAFGDSRIEDFWLQYYTNTTNITHSRMEVHNSGYAWRYIRASMSLAGLLPPLTDEGSMLLDGGYIDNLTVTHMKSLGASVVFAVDVGSIDDTTPVTWGDSLSGFWVIFNRWNIFSRQPNIPSMAEIQARLAYVSSVGALEKAKSMEGCIYIRPPIDHYATLDFNKFEEIYKLGYEFGKEFIEKLQNSGNMPKIAGRSEVELKKRVVTRRNSV